MSTKAMTWIWENSKLKGSRLLMLIAIADWCNDDGECYYGIKRLTKKVRLSSHNATSNMLRAIEKTGELTVIIHGGRQSPHGKTNYYYLTEYRKYVELETPLPNRGEFKTYDGPPKKKQGVTGGLPQDVTGELPQEVTGGLPKTFGYTLEDTKDSLAQTASGKSSSDLDSGRAILQQANGDEQPILMAAVVATLNNIIAHADNTNYALRHNPRIWARCEKQGLIVDGSVTDKGLKLIAQYDSGHDSGNYNDDIPDSSLCGYREPEGHMACHDCMGYGVCDSNADAMQVADSADELPGIVVDDCVFTVGKECPNIFVNGCLDCEEFQKHDPHTTPETPATSTDAIVPDLSAEQAIPAKPVKPLKTAKAKKRKKKEVHPLYDKMVLEIETAFKLKRKDMGSDDFGRIGKEANALLGKGAKPFMVKHLHAWLNKEFNTTFGYNTLSKWYARFRADSNIPDDIPGKEEPAPQPESDGAEIVEGSKEDVLKILADLTEQMSMSQFGDENYEQPTTD